MTEGLWEERMGKLCGKIKPQLKSGTKREILQVRFFPLHDLLILSKQKLLVSSTSCQPWMCLTYRVMVRESRARTQCWKCMSQRPGCSGVWGRAGCLSLTLPVWDLTDMHTALGNSNGRGMKGPGVWLPAVEPFLHRELKIHVSDSAGSCCQRCFMLLTMLFAD